MTTRRVMSLPALETCASVVSAYECVTEGNKKNKKRRRGFISHCSAVLFFSYSAVWYVGREVYARNTTCVIHSASQCVCTVTAVPGEPTGADNGAADMKKPLTRPLFTLCLISPLSHFLCSQACVPALIF